MNGVRLQGRWVGPGELAQVRGLIDRHPDWSRWRLSQEVVRLWDWRNAVGQWKDMAARTLLLKLEGRGWVQLPARRRLSPNRYRLASVLLRVWDQRAVTGELAAVGALHLEEVSRQREGREQVRAALGRFHYLGWRAPVGDYAPMRIMLS